MVIEAVFEDINIKHKVIKEIEKVEWEKVVGWLLVWWGMMGGRIGFVGSVLGGSVHWYIRGIGLIG